MSPFNFIAAVGSLPTNVKYHYYINLAQCLTVANRAIWSNSELSIEEQLQALKCTNEVMHRVLNRAGDLGREQQLWTEADIFETFRAIVGPCPNINGDVGGALTYAFEQTIAQNVAAE